MHINHEINPWTNVYHRHDVYMLDRWRYDSAGTMLAPSAYKSADILPPWSLLLAVHVPVLLAAHLVQLRPVLPLLHKPATPDQ
jgi:hypothetical protein